MAAALIGLLNEAAGEYVEGLERSQLDFSGALTGKVLLRHLQLKKKAFELLPFPAEPEFNYIGRVQLDIPVYSLGAAPLLAEMRDVLLLLSVKPSDSWDAEGFLAQYQQQKAEALAAGEYKALFSSLEKGLLWQLLLKLLSSFTAKVQDVHVRIEDRHSISCKPFAVGLCLKSAVLHAAPRGEDFMEPGVCKANGGLADDTFFKVISVEGLGLYVDSLSLPTFLCPSATRERERNGGPGGQEGGLEWRASKRDRRRSSAGSSAWQRASGCCSGDKGYNAACRAAYEAITAQVLQEETAHPQEAQGAEASKPKRAAPLGFGGVNTPWVQRRRIGAANEGHCPPCVSTLCCSTAPSHSSVLEEEAVFLALRPASRWSSSGLSKDLREGFSHSSMGSSAEQSYPSSSSESGLPPDPGESWVPLLQRFYREETPSPSETESNLAATLAASQGDSGGPASSLQRQLTGSLRVLGWTRLIDPEAKDGRCQASPCREGLLRSSVSEASSRAIPKRPAFLPPIHAGVEPQQQQQQKQQQQQQQGAAAATATVTGAKPLTCAVDSPDAAAGPAGVRSEAEERRRNRSNSSNSSNGSNSSNSNSAGEDSFYDAEESPTAASEAAAVASHTAASAATESKAATLLGSAATCAQQRQQQEQQQQPQAKERMQPLDKEKLDDFREFFALLWDVQHEYVLSPDTFKGQGKMFLTLVPTLPRDAPLERCWSPWGQQRAALARSEKGEQCLPSCTLFLTLPGLKVTLSSSQALQLWKWLEFCFVLRGAWEAGLLGTLEKARASRGDTQRYLMCWPVKLLRCPQPLSVLRDAGLLFTSKEDAELASKGEGDVQLQPHARASVSQPTSFEKEQKGNPMYLGEQQQEDGEDVFEGLETLEEIDAFCKTFEECHSLQTICVLRAKALRRLVALREILVSQEERQSTWRRVWQWISGGLFSRRKTIDLAAAQGDPRKLAATSVNIVEKFIEQNGVSSSRLRQVREHFFSVDFALDLAISDLQLLVVCEGRGVAVPAPRYGQRLLAVECACLHYHLQIGVTGDQTLSMDMEVYPTTVLTVARDLESALIPPEVSVLLLLEPSRQRTKQKRKGNRFFNVLQKVLGRGEDAETTAEQDPREEPHAPAGAAAADSDDAGGTLGNTKAMLSAAAADDTKEGVTTRVKDYRKQLEPMRAWSPGVYMRMDSQLFRTLHAPDLRMLLHSCAGIVVVVSPQRCLLVLSESLNLIDAARTKELLLSSNIQRAALLRQGEAFCSAVAGGDIQHPNLFLDVELHKTVSLVVPRLASRLDCEGIQIDLGSIRAKSLLQPRRLSYPPTMEVESLLDTYSCELSGLTVGRTSSCSRDLLRLRMFLGGMVLPFPKQLSSLLQLSAAATAAATATVAGGPAGPDQQQTAEPGGYMDAAGTAAEQQQQQQGGRHEGDTAKSPAEHRSEASGGDESFPSSFLVRHVKTSVISLKIAHDKFRPGVPAFHVDVIQERVSVSISQHDIELLANIAAESLEIFYSNSARLEAILREAEEQQAALDACILQQMQATCVELEQQQLQLQQQQQEGSDVERNLSHAEETVVSSVAASGIDHTTALIGTQLAISKTRAQEALVSASNTLMNSQQGVMSLEIHCVFAGFRVALLRRGPTISPKKGAGDAAGPPEIDEVVSFGNLSAAAAAAAAAAAGPASAVPSLPAFATGLRSLTARQAFSPPGSPRRQHQRRCRWAADTQGTASSATVAAAGGGAFAGFAAAAASAAEGLAAQQQAAYLISGEGGGGAEGAASGSSVPGGGLLSSYYGGWLSACFPLTEPSLGEAYRPYHTVAPLVTLLLGECFVEAVTSTDGNAQLHVALQGVELRDDTNIAPLCLSSLYLGSGAIQHPQGDAGAAEPAAPAAAHTSEAPSAASQHHYHQHRGESPAPAAAGQVSPAAAGRSKPKSSTAARFLADTHLVLEGQKPTSKTLAKARTSVMVLESRALGPRRQRSKRSPQQQQQAGCRKSQLMVSGVESGSAEEETSDEEARGALAGYRDNSLCPMLLCCPSNPHLELRLHCRAIEETAESVLSFSKARVVLVWEVLHEILRVAGQLMEELPAFPPPPAPAPMPQQTQWRDTKACHASRSRSVVHAPLKPEEQLDVIVKRLLLARKKSAPFPQTREYNTGPITRDSRWYSAVGVESKADANSRRAFLSSSTSAPLFPREDDLSPRPSTTRTASLPQQFLKAFPLRPSTRMSFSPGAFLSQGRQQEQLLPLVERLVPLEEQQQQQEEQQEKEEQQQHEELQQEQEELQQEKEEQQQQQEELQQDKEEQQHQQEEQQQQQEEQQQQEVEEDIPGALPKWVPLPSAGVSSLLNSERLLHAIEVTRFGNDESSSDFIGAERTAPKRGTAYAESSGAAVQQRRPWGLPRSAFARGENVKAVACGGGPEAFNRSNRLPRLNLLLQIHQIEVWLPTEPVRMPFQMEGYTAVNKRVSAGLASLSTSHSERRREQQHGDGAEGDGMNKSNSSPSNAGMPSALGILLGSGHGKKGKMIANKHRFDQGGSGESRAPTEPIGTSFRKRKGEMQQQQLHALPEYLLTAPVGFVSGLASAAAGIAGTTWKGKRALLSGGRSTIGASSLQQQQQQLLHTSTLARRSYARLRPRAAEYWKGLRKLVLARHRSSPEGAAVITAFAAKIPKLIALSAAVELTAGLYYLKQKGAEEEIEADRAADKETFISELEHVRRLEQSGESPLQLLAPFCPCLLRCGLFVSSICAVTTQPESLSPLLPCAISWETLKLNNPLLSPTRLQLRATLCLPSFSTLNERVWGISPEASAAIRRRYGVLAVPEPEGFALTVNSEPVLLTLDTFSVVLAYQLLAIVGAVAAAAADLFAAPPSAQKAYPGVTGDISDTFTNAPKSLPVGLLQPTSNSAAAAGGAGALLLCEQQPLTEETAALRKHSVGASGVLNPVLESFIAEQQAQRQQRQQQFPTLTDFAVSQGIGKPLWVSPEETSESSGPHELTADEALEGLLHTTAFAVEVSAELFRVAFWDTFSVSRKCCFTLTIEDIQLQAASDPRSTEMISFDPTTSTIAACSSPLVATCCAVLQREELVARHHRLRLRFRRMKGRAVRDSKMHRQLQQTETQQLQHAGSTTVTRQQGTSNSFGGPFHTWKASGGPLASKDSLFSNNSSRKQRRKQKQQQLPQQQQQQQQEQQHSASRGTNGPWQTSYSTGGGSNSFLLSQRTADLNKGGDEDSRIASMVAEGKMQGSDSLLGLPWTEERREVTGSDIASAWSTNEVTWRLWRDLDQQQQQQEQQEQQQQQVPSGRLGVSMLEALPTTVGSVGVKQGQQQQQHGAAAAAAPRRKVTRLLHWSQHGIHGRRQNGRRSMHVPKAFQLWLVSQYRFPASGGPSAPGGAMAAAGSGGQGASKGHGDTAEETVVGGSRLRRGVMASEPWVTSEASFVLSAEHLNRLEGTTDATLEPWRVETVGSKACLSSPTLLDVHASWLNLNVNVALLDALLVYGYAFIGVVVRQRSLLLLNQRRLGPKPLPPTAYTGGGASQAVGTVRRGESAETRSVRQLGGAPTEAALTELHLQGLCGSEDSDVSQALALASAAAAEVPDCYAVLRPDGTVVGSGGFDLFNALQDALSLELLGDHLLQKTSGQLSPSAEFAGDQLKVANQQQQQQLTAAAPDGFLGAQGKDKENGRPTQLLQITPRPQQQHASSAAAADAGGAAAEITIKQQENSNPLLYNLLGQPIAIMTGLHCDDGADVLSGSWFTVADQSSFSLPLDENNRVLPFLVRLRLFNYVYDLPSQVFCFSAETREVLRLSVPENPLPPTIHMQDEGGHEAGDEASDSQQKRRNFARAARQADDAGYAFRTLRTNRLGGPRGLGPSAKKVRRRGWWVPSALPRPRTSVYLLWRTSAFASVSGTPRHDLFLSSCISLRNNTELSLAVLPTIPGPLDERRSVFATFRKKFEVQPSKPPTDSMPPFARVIEAFKQQERKIKKRQTQQQQQQQQQQQRQVTTFPPVLKLPAMEHYIIEDPTSTDIGRKFSMVADNPSTDDEGVAAASAAGGGVMSAAAAVAAFTTSNAPHSGGRVKFAMEGLIEQQHHFERRMQSTAQRDTSLMPLEHQQLGTKLSESAEEEAAEAALGDSAEADAAEADAAGAAAAAATGGETGGEESGDRQQRMSNTSDEERQEEAECAESPSRKSLAPPPEAQHLLSPRTQRGKRQQRNREERDRTRRRSRRSRPHTLPKQKQPQEKVPLVQGVDYIVLDAKERQLLPVPLFWLLTENAPLWCCLAERLPKYKHKVRRFVAHPKNADFLADEKSQRAISGGLLAKYRPKRTPVPPKQIHIDEGVSLSASVVGVALRSSGMARGNLNGLFFEVVLEHCLCVCNRLPRPITLRFSPRDCGGGQQQQTFDSFMPAPPTEIQVEAGAEVSLAADPAHVTVCFGSRLSRPVAVDYFTPGTKVQRVTMDNTSDELSSSTVLFSRVEGDSALQSPHSGSRSVSLDLQGADGRRDRSFTDGKGLGQELLHEPSSLILWGEVTDHRGAAKAANSATAQRIYHGTFVRTLTLFADFWVVNRTGYVLLLRRHGNGWLQSLPPFQRVVLSHDFGASRLSVGLPASQYSKVKGFDLYAKKERTRLSRCLHAAFGARTDTVAWSGEFLLSDMGAYQIQLERTETNPLLHYSVSMGIAPAPFSRTTVVEILPAYVLVNETQKTLWICEAVGGPEARFHMLVPGAVVEFHPQAKRPVAILITGIPQRGLLRRLARADLSWQGSYGQLTTDEESKQLTFSMSGKQQQQQQEETGTTDMYEAFAKSQNGLEGPPQLSLSRKLGAMISTDTQSMRLRSPIQQQQQGAQPQVSPAASSYGLAGSCSVSVQLPQLQHGESEAPMSRLSSHSGPWQSSIKHKPSTPSDNTWQLEEETRAEGTAGMVWSGPVDIDSARLVQVRYPQEVRPSNVPAPAAGRPLARASSYLSKNSESTFCLTEVEVCLYSGTRFVRLHDPAIPDFVLLNKTSFPLFVGQHGVPAYEVVCPVPRQHLKRSYEFLGSRYGLPFAFYDPTKEKKLEVWRMSSASASLTHRLSGRLSHLHSRLRSGSRQSLALRTSGVGRGPPVGDATVHPQGFGGPRPGHSWSLSRIYDHKKGEGAPGGGLLHSGVSGQDMGGRCDANTLRRIRREYAESISLKGSQGQQGLIRLVLQSITGPVVQGAPPPQVERVVVCVRRPVVKGSTYLVFFEPTRSLPELAKGSLLAPPNPLLGGLENVRESLLELDKVPGSLQLRELGPVRERILQLASIPPPGHLHRIPRPDAVLAHGAEKTLKNAEGGSLRTEGSLPWQSEGREGGESCSVLRTTIPPYPPMAAGAGVSNEMSQKRSIFAGRPPGGPSFSLASDPQEVGGAPPRGLETPEAPLIPRLPGWLRMDGLIGAGEDALHFGGGAAEAAALHGASAIGRRKLRRKSRRRLNSGKGDIEVEESDEEETERSPLCSSDLSVNLFLVGAGLSLIDSKPAEIFYASVELLQVFFKQTQEGEKLRLTVGWVQIDNHAPMAYYPTMLRPITDVRANVSPTGLSANAKPLQQAPLGAAAAADAAAETPQGGDGALQGHTESIPNITPRLGEERSQKRRQARAGLTILKSEGGESIPEMEETFLGGPAFFPQASISARPKALTRSSLPEAEEVRALHAEEEGLKLMEEEDAVAQLILERRNTMDGRGLTVIPQCVLRLAPLSVNIDFQLAFALLLFVDDVLRTIDLDLLQQSVKDIRTSEDDADSPSWRAMLGPVDGALTEVIRGSGDGAGKVFLGTLDVGRVMLVINIRNKRRGGEEEEQPHSELIRGVLAIMKSSPYISDANLVFASELHQNLCGPLVTLVSDILQKYIGQAIKQIFQLLGAVDLFGNPVIMCKHWKSGAVGCFFEVRRGMALWGTPGFAFLSFGRGFALFGTALVAGFLDSFGRFFGSWFQCLEAFARNSDAYSVLPEMQGQGGVADQPGSIAEGLVSGGKGFAFTLAVSLANFCVKPVKATQMHLSQHSAGNKTERLAAGAKGLGIGIASGLGSLCFGIPSSLLLLLSSSCVGTLNQIQAVPMLESVRPRRVFGIGGWRADSYSFALALAHSSFPRASRASSAQFVFTIPVYRQREEGEALLESEERLQRLELRLQQHSRIHHHQRRRKTHVFLAVGLRKLGLLEGKKVLWSCFRGDVAQLQIVKSFSRDGNNPNNNTFFLSLLHFKTEGKPPPDEGLARHVREGLRQRANLGDVNLAATDSSTVSGSSYRSSAIGSSSSSSNSSNSGYSDTEETEDVDFDFSESSSDLSAATGGPSADPLKASSDGTAAAAAKTIEADVAAKKRHKALSGKTPGPADSQPGKSPANWANGADGGRRRGLNASFPSQKQKQQQQRRWRVLKQVKIGGWLVGKGRSEDVDALKKMFALRWIEFASEAAALQAFDVLSHLLDSPPGQGAADPTLFTIL